ncbi:hypothetical protein Mapa_002327 [Marchantia paleacea]|nr:hypothetical protein Mapa_002327 [Marchantia paleacea]
MWDSDERNELAEGEAELSEDEFFLGATSSENEISDEETENSPPVVGDRDEYFVAASSSDESLDSEADELDLWVSGIDEAERAPLSVQPVEAVASTEQAEKDSPKPYALRSTSEKTARDLSKDIPMDRGQTFKSAPSFIVPVNAVGSASEAEKDLSKPAALGFTSQDMLPNSSGIYRWVRLTWPSKSRKVPLNLQRQFRPLQRRKWKLLMVQKKLKPRRQNGTS